MKLAIIGVGGLVCEALLEQLAELSERPASLVLLDEEVDEDVNPLFDGRHQAVLPIADFDFESVDVAVFVDNPDLAESHLERIHEQGVTVVDGTGWSARQGIGSLVLPAAAGELEKGSHVACPDPIIALLAEFLQLVAAEVPVQAVQVTVCQPVSVAGKRGIDALAGEAARLLNGLTPEDSIFPEQMAFNLLPEKDSGQSERAARSELRHLLGNPELQLAMSLVTAPVFYGALMSVSVQAGEAVQIGALESAFSTAGVDLVSGDQDFSPVNSARSTAMTLSALRSDADDPCRLSCWLIADNIRKGAALNIIRFVEMLIKTST